MKSAIEEVLFKTFGNQNPDLGNEYWELRKVTQAKEDKLLELIKDNEEAIKAFYEYQNSEGENSGIEVIGFYKEGFRNGFRLAIDTLDDN